MALGHRASEYGTVLSPRVSRDDRPRSFDNRRSIPTFEGDPRRAEQRPGLSDQTQPDRKGLSKKLRAIGLLDRHHFTHRANPFFVGLRAEEFFLHLASNHGADIARTVAGHSRERDRGLRGSWKLVPLLAQEMIEPLFDDGRGDHVMHAG